MGFNGKLSQRWNLKCGECEKEIILLNHQYLFRKQRSKSGKLFCSRKCSAQSSAKHPVEIKEAV